MKREKKPKNPAKRKRRLIALGIVLAVTLILLCLPWAVMTGTPGVIRLGEKYGSDARSTRFKAGERYFLGLGKIANALVPVPKNIPEAQAYQNKDFYAGSGDFRNTPGTGWRLGFASRSIVPEDVLEKDYYIGGNAVLFPRKIKRVIDDIKVRALALEDGGGSGITVFAAVDVIGLANSQVREIRALLAKAAPELSLSSVNVMATHAHSSIDTLGAWSASPGEILGNWVSLLFRKDVARPAMDPTYRAFLNETVVAAILDAVGAMEPGKLFYSQIGVDSTHDFYEKGDAAIGFDDETDEWDDSWTKKWIEWMASRPASELGLLDYVFAKRSPGESSSKLHKLRFVPTDSAARETVWINLWAHPYINGLKLKAQGDGSGLSGDFPYYMEEVFAQANANMFFSNGAINGIYPDRGAVGPVDWSEDAEGYLTYFDSATLESQAKEIGRDFASIALAMTMQKDEIEQNPLTKSEGRSHAYRALAKSFAQGGGVTETELPPLLNVRLQEIQVSESNPLLILMGKLRLAENTILNAGGSLKTLTEVGYMELGGLKFAMIPGEITPGLTNGKGDTIAKNAFSGQDFSGESLRAAVDGEGVLVLGLCNDEVGYIIPENDYCQFYWDADHYQELISPGREAAGEITGAFARLADQVPIFD
ncbi:MAG: hypothetical protein LBQ33_03980 [Oscillospiraceae bacterium]|nr:hypothetical protein [Oscillospiraceae bacterium]